LDVVLESCQEMAIHNEEIPSLKEIILLTNYKRDDSLSVLFLKEIKGKIIECLKSQNWKDNILIRFQENIKDGKDFKTLNAEITRIFGL